MNLVDTHTHLYLDDFKTDIDIVIENAIQNGITRMLLPNIDSESIEPMLDLCRKYPLNCFPMIGLHPTSVKDNYEIEIEQVEKCLQKCSFVAIGEIGIDLYWDKTFENQQIETFLFQVKLAKKYGLPIAIHTRNSFEQTVKLLESVQSETLKGVFHCFGGTLEEAQQAIGMGYKLGIGGVVTFKNSKLAEVVKEIGLQHILLETDAPFLAPHPFRGKRNESTYLKLIAEKIAEIKNISLEEVARVTTQNSMDLFFPKSG